MTVRRVARHRRVPRPADLAERLRQAHRAWLSPRRGEGIGRTTKAGTAAVDHGGSGRVTLAQPHHQGELERYGYTVLPPLDTDVLRAVRHVHARVGVAPDDPQVALNWSFHSTSSAHKQAVKNDVGAVLRPVLDDLFVAHEAYLTTFITKWPGPHSAFAPHQDPSLVDERSYRGVTVWIPLEATGTDGETDNGMLHVVPGSHRFSKGLRRSDVDAFPFAAHEEAIVSRHGLGLAMEAGEVLVFDNRLIHYSKPNTSAEPRVVVSFGMRPREASCVLLREREDAVVDLHHIHDDFYIEVLPAEQHLWVPPDPPVARVPVWDETWTAEEFDRLCRAIGPAPRTSVATRNATAWQDPGAFCALCGSSQGLSDEDRAGRNNAQLVCPPCRVRLDRSGSGPARVDS